MSKQECQQLKNAYIKWFREGLSVRNLGTDVCELTTPFLDRHNDHIQIYAVRRNEKTVLSDGGYVLSELRTSNINLNSPKSKAALEHILRGVGARMKEKELIIEVPEDDSGQQLHSLIHAILAIDTILLVTQAKKARQ